MKSRLIHTVLVFGLLGLADVPMEGAVRLKLGLSADYHALNDPAYESIYGNGGMMFGANVALQVSRSFEIRAEAGVFRDKGAMTASREDLSLTLRPFILALRLAPLEVGRFRPFVGAGLGTISIRENYPEPISDFSGSANLLILEAGVYIKLVNHVHVAAQLRFMNAKATAADLETIDLGGWCPGLGLTYAF